jgi:hypothetical protein
LFQVNDYKYAMPLVLAAALAGCGGGGGGGSATESASGSGTVTTSAQADATSGSGTVTSGSGTVTSSTQADATSGSAVATGTSTATTPAPASTTPTSLDKATYVSLANNWGTTSGIAFRYGAASTVSDSGLPSAYDRGFGTAFTTGAGSQRPNVGAGGYGGSWQIGGPAATDPGDYFSNMANVAFVADDPSQSPGVAVFQQIAVSNNGFSQLPQISWVYADGMKDPNIRALNLGAVRPTAMGRCAGRPGWCVNSIVAFQDGTIANARGSNTALNQARLKLDANLVPTAVAVSNSAEFAMVTVWDTVNQRGRVAVIALTGLCNGCTLSNPANEQYWGEWKEAHPGLANLGNIGYMKLLGYVDLPDGMSAPTEIAISTGWNPWDTRDYPDRDTVPLSVESNRAAFKDGGPYQNAYAKTGMAVVLSKSDRKAAFIDLRPLFQYYKKMYFGTTNDFNSTKNVGNAANQWPFPFSAVSEQVPRVVKVVNFDSPPTAVKLQLWGSNPRAWIATEEGALRFFGLGNYMSTAGGGTPDQIQQTGSVPVGANPTGLSYYRAEVGSMSNIINTRVLVASRGERKIQWIDIASNGASGSVWKTLRDRNLKDPIAIDDNDSHGSSVSVVTVADFAKGVTNFRYSPIVMHSTYSACQGSGCATNGGDFEFAGPLTQAWTMDGLPVGQGTPLPGKAFAVAGSNVP